MTATTAEKPQVKPNDLPLLDKARIIADARKWVTHELAEHAGRSRAHTAARAKRASEIVHTETEALAKVRTERDAAAYTLVLNYWIRRGANVAGALGVQRSRWQIIREEQTALIEKGEWTGPIDNALEVLPGLAAAKVMHEARADYARAERNQTVRQLLKMGMSNADIARLIGNDPSLISTLKNKEAVA